MKWFVALTLVVASVSLLVPALLRASETAQSNGRLDQIHETATF
jgi:hypothetical protein